MAGVIASPTGSCRICPARERDWLPEPYLGEFIPAETPAQREQRESMAKLRMLLKKAEQGL